MSEFSKFSRVIAARFEQMSKQKMFVVGITGDQLWGAYLAAFPEGANPIYKTNTAHHCNCCRSFIKAVGNVVVVSDDLTLKSIWDVVTVEPYATVAKKLSELVRGELIANAFYTSESSAGKEFNIQLTDEGATIKWEHFHCDINASPTANADRGRAFDTTSGVRRAFEELAPEAVNEVHSLMLAGGLYRGTADAQKNLRVFAQSQHKYLGLGTEAEKSAYIWTRHPTLAIRNTSIGTLLQALTAGTDLETAAGAYERMVAPTNYRRTTALVTKGMIEKALTKLDSLGLRGSVNRRYATEADMPISSALWVASARGTSITGDPLADAMLTVAKPSGPPRKAGSTVGIGALIEAILPGAEKLEVLFDRKHVGNLVSLTTSVDPESPPLFSWAGNLAWAYRGDVTGPIKERVKKAGGEVSGWGRVSLGWFNYDDLDLAVVEPDGTKIWFRAKSPRGSLGSLDVDMNVHQNGSREAVENLTWPRQMRFGTYTVMVTNFTKRESCDVGFDLEADIGGTKAAFRHERAVKHGETILVCKITVDERGVAAIVPVADGVKVGSTSVEEWGLKTEEYQEVDMLTLSPNETGMRHWFFLMHACKNPGQARGFYIDFLRPDLREHRKVFEVLGTKTMAEPSGQQLSGLGFSSTTRDTISVKVDGRPYNVTI